MVIIAGVTIIANMIAIVMYFALLIRSKKETDNQFNKMQEDFDNFKKFAIDDKEQRERDYKMFKEEREYTFSFMKKYKDDIIKEAQQVKDEKDHIRVVIDRFHAITTRICRHETMHYELEKTVINQDKKITRVEKLCKELGDKRV